MAVEIGSVLGGVGSGLLKGAFYVLIVVFFGGGLAVITWWIKNMLKYKAYIVRVFEKDSAGNVTAHVDGGAIFIDKKSGMQCFFLQHARIGLSSNKIPFIINAQGKREVYVYKAGERNYRFINTNLNVDHIEFTVGDEDVNQALIAIEKADKTYLRGWLEKFMPYIVIGIVLVIFLIAFTYSMQQWEKASEHFASLASAINNMNRTTTILTS